jgi:secreted trypsin-like serine protease
MNKVLRTPAITLLTFLLFFCGIYRHDVPREGVLALARQSQFDCVGRVTHSGEAMGGSCVLIGPRYAISAAHVFTVFTAGSGRAINSASGYTFSFGGRDYHASRITAYPTWIAGPRAQEGDLVFIELTEAVEGVEPAVLNTQFDELNTRVVGVGYGVAGRADIPDSVGPCTEKTAGENMIDSADGYTLAGRATVLRCDFDHPSKASLNKMGSATPLPMEYASGGGDSGGGLFSNAHGRWELVGICSEGSNILEELFVTGYYGGVMGWTRVASFVDWIKAQRKE